MRSNNKSAALAVLALTAAWSLPGAAQDRRAVVDGPVILGPSYAVDGTTYTPADPAYYDEVGYATLIAGGSQNGATATGEAFAPDSIMAAHKTLPLPSYVEVTALESGRTILVRVNDRGPMANDRLIALSPGAAAQLGIEAGSAVRVRRVNPPEQERAVLRAGGKAAERLPTPAPLLKALRAKLPAALPHVASAPVSVTKPKPVAKARPGADFDRPPPTPGPVTPPAKVPPKAAALVLPPAKVASPSARYLVQLGAFSTQARAKALADRVGGHIEQAGTLWRVRTGPFATREAAQAGLRAAAAKGVENGSIITNDGR
jgi:rare lipoprotein A